MTQGDEHVHLTHEQKVSRGYTGILQGVGMGISRHEVRTLILSYLQI